MSACRHAATGNRRGWRLPAIQELASLTEPGASFPALPPGHPFDISGGFFWSANTYWGDPALALGVGMAGGTSGEGVKLNATSFVLCVRGGAGLDPQ